MRQIKAESDIGFWLIDLSMTMLEEVSLDEVVMRFMSFLVLMLFGQQAHALCNGPSFFDRLSDTQRAEIDTRASQTPYGQGLLWTATRDDQSILVIGTIHLYDPRLAPILERIEDEIAAADMLLVEATAKEEKQMQRAVSTTPELAFITEGPTLPERLDPELRNYPFLSLMR